MQKLLSILVVVAFTWPGLAGASTQPADAPSGARAERETADAWADLGNWKRATDHYRKALALDPGLTEARMRLANGLYRLGDHEGALAELAKLPTRGEHAAAVAAAAAVIYLDEKQPAQACTWFAKALTAAPEHGRSLYGAGQCHHALFDQTKKAAEKKAALTNYQAYLEHHPKGPWALPAKEKVEALQLGDAGVKLAMAKQALADGKFRLAERSLKGVAAEHPDLEEAHYLLGVALASPVLDDLDGAIEAWQKAPHDKRACLQLGITAFEDDEPAEAIEHLERALKLDDKFAEAWYQLGLVHFQLVDNQDKQGHLDRARRAFARVKLLAPKSKMAARAASKLQLITGQVRYLSESEVIDTASEVSLGRKLTGQIEKRFGLVDDEATQARLNRILHKISNHSERLAGALPYKIKILDVDGINALSFTGGTIYIYKGLLDFVRVELADSDDALAAIIAHEVVHVDRRHGLGMLDLVGGASQLLEGRSLNVRSLQTLMKGISRRNEYEADQIGALYAYRAGYNPAAAFRFHRRMIATGHEVPDGLDHPTHVERGARLKEYLLSLRAKARYFKRGLAAIDAGEYSDAVRHLEVFLGVFPNNLAARNNLGVALHREAMRKRIGENAYKLSTDLDPRSRIRKVRLRAAATEGFSPDRAKMEEAAMHFSAILRREPGYLPARQNLGACLLALGETDQALEAFRKAQARGEAGPEIRNNLAVAELLAGKAEAGQKLLRKLIAEKPQFADAYFNLGAALQAAGDKTGARKAYLAYMARDKDSGWAQVAKKRLAELN